jgi:cytochrome c oxidase assembly protein subunit 11
MQATTRTALLAGGVVATMASLSFAAVPFYNWFCSVTGFGGATMVGTGDGVEVSEDTVVVRFVASTERGMPWSFRPSQNQMTVRLGETALAFYEASNPTSRPVAGQASYNVAPDAAGGFFLKVDCFCFTEQVLQPGETVEMPVSFYVDPAILEDADGRGVREITLGYTFYEIDLPPPEEQAALAPAALPAPAGHSID